MYRIPYVNGLEVNTTASTLPVDPIWMLVAVILAIIGGILVYFLFVKSKQEFKGNLGYLRRFLGFNRLFIEDLIKIFYLIAVIFVTLLSFGMINTSFLLFVLVLTLGNLGLRVFYELMLIGVLTYRNIAEINSKLKNQKK